MKEIHIGNLIRNELRRQAKTNNWLAEQIGVTPRTVNKIFSFKITKFAKEVIVTPDEPDDIYWGFKTLSTNKGLKNSLKLVNPDFVVETTKYADTIDTIFDELKTKVESSNHIAIVFGGPYSSISENVESSKWETIKLNTIPNQGTETVRTEEAVISTLAIFNIL